MIWFTWRQHRVEILVSGIFLLFIAAILVGTGLHIAAFAQHVGMTNCPAPKCGDAQNKLNTYIEAAFGGPTFYTLFQYMFLALPLLIGMFIGAGVVARELEQGTYRLVWTQSISWARWLLSKIGVLMLFVLCATSLLYALFSWWKAPALTITFTNNFWYINYDVWSVVSIAYTLFALALGIYTGTIVRKTVPAMVITLVIFVGLRILIEVFWRPYFLPPVVVSFPFTSLQGPSPQSLMMTTYYTDRQGNRLDPYVVCAPKSLQKSSGTTSSDMVQLSMTTPSNHTHTLSGGPDPNSPQAQAQQRAWEQCITSHGFQQVYLVQPASRFWLFQGIESAIYLFMSVILLALTFWWIKHRIIGMTR